MSNDTVQQEISVVTSGVVEGDVLVHLASGEQRVTITGNMTMAQALQAASSAIDLEAVQATVIRQGQVSAANLDEAVEPADEIVVSARHKNG